MSLDGNTAKINELLSKINALPEETTPSYQEKTVTPSTSAQTVTPDSGYDALSKVTVNAMTTATQATPSISVSSGGLITAKATQSAGYVAAGTKQATEQLTVQAAQTITPGTADKTISSGRYLTGTQTIKGDSNLVAGNIKSGVSIFGVTGSYEGSSGGGSGTIESCTVTFRDAGNLSWLTCTTADLATAFLTYKDATYDDDGWNVYSVLNAAKGSILVAYESDNADIVCTGAELIGHKNWDGYDVCFLEITGDAIIEAV